MPRFCQHCSSKHYVILDISYLFEALGISYIGTLSAAFDTSWIRGNSTGSPCTSLVMHSERSESSSAGFSCGWLSLLCARFLLRQSNHNETATTPTHTIPTTIPAIAPALKFLFAEAETVFVDVDELLFGRSSGAIKVSQIPRVRRRR